MSNKSAATYGPGRTTPPLEARVAAVLAGHQYDPDGCVCTCSDEVQVGLRCDSQTHSQHVATMLAPVFAEAQAEALESFASHYLHPEQDKHYLRESQTARVGYRQAVQAHANRYRNLP